MPPAISWAPRKIQEVFERTLTRLPVTMLLDITTVTALGRCCTPPDTVVTCRSLVRRVRVATSAFDVSEKLHSQCQGWIGLHTITMVGDLDANCLAH